jgi:hypothetical protein
LRTLGECLCLYEEIRQIHGPKVLLPLALVIKGLRTAYAKPSCSRTCWSA